MAFDWFKKDRIENDKTKQPTRRPKSRDISEGYVANSDLTIGLYKNNYSGLKLAGGLVFPMITIPVYFMGYPSFRSSSERTTEEANRIVASMLTQIKQLHIACHREGTIWVWPRFDSETMELVWEFIPDDCISDVIRDVRTGRVKAVLTDEEIKVGTARDTTQTVRRQRTFTSESITDSYTGAQIEGLENEVLPNALGILPIAFANNLEPTEIRGSSDLSRVLPLLAGYHELSRAELEILAQFRPKMVQNLATTLKDWLSNNGYDSIADVDINDVDFIANVGEESTEFIKPGEITDGYRAAKVQLFRQMVETSGVPEIAWGLKTEGNNASVEESMTTLVNFAKDKQEQKEEPYRRLLSASLRIMGAVNTENLGQDLQITWNDIDVMSAKTKAEVFNQFANGVSRLMLSSGTTPDQLFQVWQQNYPGIGPQTVEEFTQGLKATAAIIQFQKANYLEALDAAGEGGSL